MKTLDRSVDCRNVGSWIVTSLGGYVYKFLQTRVALYYVWCSIVSCTCMNMAVDLSWWFQVPTMLFKSVRCQAMISLFQHARTHLSTTLFKLSSSTIIQKTSCAFLRVYCKVLKCFPKRINTCSLWDTSGSKLALQNTYTFFHVTI